MIAQKVQDLRPWLFECTLYKHDVAVILTRIVQSKLFPSAIASMIAAYVGGKHAALFCHEPNADLLSKSVLHISQICKTYYLPRPLKTIYALLNSHDSSSMGLQICERVAWPQVESVVERARDMWRTGELLELGQDFKAFEIVYDFLVLVVRQ